jgi:hypothetical protein
MTEAKTVQKKVRPITIRCAAEGCTEKGEGAAMSEGDGEDEIIAPRGWTFGAKPDPRSKGDVVYGFCPQHGKKK